VTSVSNPARSRSSFYFKESDAELLRRAVEYRFLQPCDFQRLTGRNIVSLRRRLRQLVQNGYLERLTLPVERDAPIGNPPDAFVYQLSRRGILKAKAYGMADEGYCYTREKSNLFLQHDLIVTRIHLTIELATRGTPLQLIAWEQRRSVLLDWAENGNGRLSVNPDALFGLKNREKPEGQDTTYFFLEVVRSRESDYQGQQSYFMRKMHAFLAYHRQGRHSERYGITNFRVITVTPTKQRTLNLCEKLRNAGLGSKRFWFTDLGPICADDSPRILEKVFFTPKDFEGGALYSLRD
jgi:protein involved in plasmid replication-relaxation